jgi:molecular chaperone GrpE (heat shock protein)
MRFVPFWWWRAAGVSGRPSARAPEEMTPAPECGVADQLDRLASDVARLGREQFRATTLLEACGSSLDELGSSVREHIDEACRDQAQSMQALDALESEVRRRLATDLLPVADALQASIAAVRSLIQADRQASDSRPRGRLRLGGRIQRLLGAGYPGLSEPDHVAALEGWLEGLVLVERRLLALLDREGVRPIAAVGKTFDPHQHLAVAVSDAYGGRAGMVVAEQVRGYTLGDRILRHAEVVVARSASQSACKEGVGHDDYRRD